jgi:hypothetical protein
MQPTKQRKSCNINEGRIVPNLRERLAQRDPRHVVNDDDNDNYIRGRADKSLAL